MLYRRLRLVLQYRSAGLTNSGGDFLRRKQNLLFAAPHGMRVLVTGATDYIGGRMVPRLVERGHAVRVLVRDPERIVGRPWADRVEVAAGDLRR